MWYSILIIIAVLTTAVLLLSVRLRICLSPDEKTVFAGLGRSGMVYDFSGKQLSVFLAGRRIKDIESKKKKPKKKVKTEKKPEKEELKKPKKTKRVRSWRDILKIIPKSSKAAGRYFLSILKSVVIEELNGEVRAGFESPDLTGRVFGYYQAAVGAMPSMAGRVSYIPIWDEECFEGSVRASVAIPLYKIVYRTLILIIELPLREIVKLAIGKKERRP